MGKTSRWFRGLFGLSKVEENAKQQQQQPKAGWRFGKSRRESQKLVLVGVDTKKHAIVTEGIAKAAVSTAQATVATVSLTNRGLLNADAPRYNLGIRESAAVKIQSYFRGYLARRALRALKGLVKLQALVRGYIIRKKTANMLSRFHSLLRIQTRAKLSRAQVSHLPHCKLAQSKSGHLLRRNGSVSNARRASDLDNVLTHRKWNSLVNCYTEDENIEDVAKYRIPRTEFTQKSCNNNNSSLSFSTSNDDSTTAQDHLIPSPSSCGIQSVVHYKTKETPFCTPSNSPMMMCYSSSEYGDSYNQHHPSYMAYTESSKAKIRSLSAPKQRITNQFERLGSTKRHLVYGTSSPSTYPNFANKLYPGSGRMDRIDVPDLY